MKPWVIYCCLRPPGVPPGVNAETHVTAHVDAPDQDKALEVFKDNLTVGQLKAVVELRIIERTKMTRIGGSSLLVVPELRI